MKDFKIHLVFPIIIVLIFSAINSSFGQQLQASEYYFQKNLSQNDKITTHINRAANNLTQNIPLQLNLKQSLTKAQ